MKSQLAIFGGPKAIKSDPGDIFTWPIITKEDEDAVLDVLRKGTMSGKDVTIKFEQEFAAWLGKKYALGFCNGTAAIQAAMYGCSIGTGDEIICPSFTYWASAIQVFSIGGTVVFADIDPDSLCIDPRQDNVRYR
jgi:dTDP-4-amino-4,6-dideoxygalactose transaminase